MIEENEIFRFGRLLKPHGLQGEITFYIEKDIFENTEDFPYFVCDIDGIFVPFHIEDYRLKNEELGYVKFEEVNSDKEAKALTNRDLYVKKEFIQSDDEEEGTFYLDDFVGYVLKDQYGVNIGEISDFIDSPANPLYVVQRPDGREVFIPAQDELIAEMDNDNRYLKMELPDGILDIDSAESDFE